MDAASKGVVEISGLDALSFCYHTKKGGSKIKGVIYWLFHRKVTVTEASLHKCFWSMRDKGFMDAITPLLTRKAAKVETGIRLPRATRNNGCGAQTLRQAADEFGMRSLPRKGMLNGEDIKESSAEQALFNATMQARKTPRGDTVSPEKGYAGVVHILAVAREMGLKGRIYSSYKNWINMHLIRPEAELWRQINGYSPIKLGSVPSLCDSERLIVHCQKPAEQGHFVMLRPDGSFYDPETGKQYIDKAVFVQETKWQPSGWSVLLHNEAGLLE